MDSLHHHQQQHQQQQQDHRILGPPVAGGGGDHRWYPSSSPPPPPPPSAGGYFNHGYHHPPPPQPQPISHLQHQQHSHHPIGPPPTPLPLHPQGGPPPFHGQHALSPSPYPPPPHPGQYHPPPPPLPPRPLHHGMPPPMMSHHQPPPSSAYPPPPNQAWGNPSWGQHQVWEYPERNVPFNEGEDWAARAKAWAAGKSGTEIHHPQSHFSPIGRMDEVNYTYHDQHHAVGGPRDFQPPSYLQGSNQQLPVGSMDPAKQVNHLHGSTSFSSVSSSYGTGYYMGDETANTNADHVASPHKSYGPGPSTYEQEVSYSYSSAPGQREAPHHHEGSQIQLPSPVSSIHEGHHSLSALPVQRTTGEPPHMSNHGPPANFLPDVCDRPLDFVGRHNSNHESHQKINFGYVSTAGMIDHDPTASSLNSWTPSTASGVGFPQIPLVAAGTQFDPAYIPQTSLPVQPPPLFGGIPAASFQPSIPAVSTAYGLGPGASLPGAAFRGDLNGALNLSERPKKAAVPNWLREEIIKKKPVISNAISTQLPGNSFDSVGSEDGDKSFRLADQGDNKSIDSTRSAEDEEDEEDVEAVRSAAINQEIKRVLTEVLLKVTDELFDEIATKVLKEDDQITEVPEEGVNNRNQKMSILSSPVAVPTTKASAKALVPTKMETQKVDNAGDNSSTSSPGGNILGLANYGSDEDEDASESSKLLSSEIKASDAHQHDGNDKPVESSFRTAKGDIDIRLQEDDEKSSLPVDDLHYPDRGCGGLSAVSKETMLVDSREGKEQPLEGRDCVEPLGTVGGKNGKGHKLASGPPKNAKTLNKENYGGDLIKDVVSSKNPQKKGGSKSSLDKTSQETSDASDSTIPVDRNEPKEKLDKRDKKERAEDRSSQRGSNANESDSRRSSKHHSFKNDKKEIINEKREKYREDGERKREQEKYDDDDERKRQQPRDEKEDRSTRGSKDSSRYGRRSSPPSSRGKSIKDNSFSHDSAPGDEPSDNSKKRKKLSHNSSLSPSPTRSRKRQISRSPPSKHSHRRHSPYSSSQRRRSRSVSPGWRRHGAHRHGS